MSPRLPPVLSRSTLPEAELYAARLDGELFSIDECFSPIDEVECSGHRARALLPTPSARLIAERQTAAWVLGASDRAPARHQFCTNIATRVRVPSELRLEVREVVIDDSEVMVISGLQVTTPLRTALDLARFSIRFGSQERAAVIALMEIGDFDVTSCAAAMNRRRNLPRKQLALARIEEAAGHRTAPRR